MNEHETTATDAHVDSALIDAWFPVAAVDEACGTSVGSGLNEKAIFTWFASRPIAQARAAVLCSVLPDGADDTELHELVEEAVRTGSGDVLKKLAAAVPDVEGKRPVVLDCFSGRGMIPLEAARLGLRAVGTDLSPVAVLASRLLADFPLRDWSGEPDVDFEGGGDSDGDGSLFGADAGEPKLIRDLRVFFAEVGRRVEAAVGEHYPTNADGSRPWGYLWATTIPCDNCKTRFPLVGSLTLRQPYTKVGDPGQYFSIDVDKAAQTWDVSVHEGVPLARPTMAALPGKRGKSARCPFCEHNHPLDAVKAKGFAGQYTDVPLIAADLSTVDVPGSNGRSRSVERKVFRCLRPEEVKAATSVDPSTEAPFGDLPAAPTEPIAHGNKDSVRGTGYGCETWADLMNDRQCLLLIETVRAIRSCRNDAIVGGTSEEYTAVLAAYASGNLIRRLRVSTHGAVLRAHGNSSGTAQNRNKTDHIFSNEASIAFNFDWFETGPGAGPGTWSSLTKTTLTPLATHISGLTHLADPGRFRRATATALPYRDNSIDAVVCDPPYYSMIDYADISDLFYVWLRRCLHDIIPDLFGEPGDQLGLQDKTDEIIVKRGAAAGDRRTTEWYETQLANSFKEMQRVLKPGGTLAVVFGHSDPAAWRRILGALRDAGFVVAAAWPARTEAANTGVASIKVTITIGCQVAPPGRKTTTAAQAEREIVELVAKRVPKWERWGLALSDQLMASYGPSMQIVGQYSTILQPDGTEPDLDYFLNIGRQAVGDTHAFKVDEIPLETFDAETRFSLFWMRAHQLGPVGKGEAVFEAQTARMRIDDVRGTLLKDTKGGYTIALGEPPEITDRSPAIHIARALGHSWAAGGTDSAAQVLSDSKRPVDDTHVWATVGELIRQLPDSDELCKALTQTQRNRSTIEKAARQLATAAEDAEAQQMLPGGFT